MSSGVVHGNSYFDHFRIKIKVKLIVQLPVSWQPSADGRFLIGHLLLYKNLSTTSQSARQAGALLGLKVSHIIIVFHAGFVS